jgi:tetratricopeptide (TPR) repeat protein
MTTTTARAVLLAAVMAAGSTPLSAAPARGQARVDPATQARTHYELGMKAYERRDYDGAIAAFRRAHDLDPRPNLLYNIAQSYWKKGDNAQALDFYRRYLDAAPGAPDGKLIGERIRELSAAASAPPSSAPPGPTAAIASATGGVRYWEPGSPAAAREVTTAPTFAALPPPPEEVVAEDEPPAVYRRPLFWGAVGVAALTAVAAILWLRPQDRWSCQAAECFATRTVP